jgi:hypothetical protein
VKLEFRAGLRAQQGKLVRTGGTEVHAASFLTQGRIVLDEALLSSLPEFIRILSHELAHFAWRRMAARDRNTWYELVAKEWRAKTRGELGWSAEWRKEELTARDVREQTRRFRDYACEAFCDTAAWLHAAPAPHPEFTLAHAARRARRKWFQDLLSRSRLRI